MFPRQVLCQLVFEVTRHLTSVQTPCRVYPRLDRLTLRLTFVQGFIFENLGTTSRDHQHKNKFWKTVFYVGVL